MDRRIAAIFVADMVGSTRLMERDERDVITRHKAHLSEVFETEFSARRGRVIKGTGDGLIGAFDSVVDALEAALAIQKAMVEREATGDRQIAYRIAIHLGDVMFDEDDVYGDGVNIAARLEGEAEPGGIVVSGAARDMLKDQVDVSYGALGDLTVKGVSEPVRAYVIGGTGQKRRSAPNTKLVAAAFAALVIGVGWWWNTNNVDFEPADLKKYALTLPNKPSIAVLPFDNKSGDSSKDYLGDGLTDSLITTLGKHPKLFVIARNSSFTYKGKATKVQTIAEELGVRYILDGSFQTSDQNLRVSAQLVDALNGQNRWAETYEYDLSTDGLFSAYDAILRSVVVELNQQLISSSSKDRFRDAGDLMTFSLLAQSIAELQKFTPASNLDAREKALEALERNPNSITALNSLAWVSWFNVLTGQNPREEMMLARKYATQALELDPASAGAHSVLSWLDLFVKDYSSAVAHADKSLELDPGGGMVASLAAWVYAATGNPQKGIELFGLGMRTEPFYPAWVPASLARAYMMVGRFKDAEDLLSSVTVDQRNAVHKPALVVAHIGTGQTDKAKAVVREILARRPTALATDHLRFFSYIKDKTYLDMYTAALVTAGMPEG